MLLQINNLAVGFKMEAGKNGASVLARAVDGVSLSLDKGRALCLAGESGCGKSVTAMSVLGLLPSPPARILSGEAVFEGRDLLRLGAEELNRLRGARIGMIFQEPMTSLNPVLTVGEQVAEPLMLHLNMSGKDALGRAVELLDQVGISNPRERAGDYPHQLSGGMRQRVMIAMAMACGPSLLMADEPTTALDVSIQAQIMDLLRKMREASNSALLLITHDLDLAARNADDMAVMYAGKIVESGPIGELMPEPLHPYTRGLIASRPRLPALGGSGGESAARLQKARRGRLPAIPGTVPSPLDRPAGCAFSTRCPEVFDKCRRVMPDLAVLPGAARRSCRCWLYQD